MRLLVKLGLLLAIVVVLAVGLLPPLVAKSHLAAEAADAARAGSAAAGNMEDSQAAYDAVAQALVADPGVHLVSVRVEPSEVDPVVIVTLSKQVHTFMSGLPGLESWFRIQSSQQSSLGQ